MCANEQSKAKRACIDCHFLSIGLVVWCGSSKFSRPHYKSADLVEAYSSVREHIKKRESVTLGDYEFETSCVIDGISFALICQK